MHECVICIYVLLRRSLNNKMVIKINVQPPTQLFEIFPHMKNKNTCTRKKVICSLLLKNMYFLVKTDRQQLETYYKIVASRI